ncbi:flagellar protein FliT [Marinimicrobium agarilyticum]|uniref:flagellar protein FliT n=1 Tax=Marinimicrobium agarilyticum TaxID=306546 RepID=UPI000411C167|nr:flagellar protein FliT [Marinimicrobium agarilyticum]
MNEPDLLDAVYRFRDYTRELLALAREDEWQAFEDKASEREALIAALNDSEFLVAVAKADRAEELKREIAAIQSLNDEITALAERTKADIAGQLKQKNHQDRAIKAYKPSK